MSTKRFRIAFSFAGEKRDFVEQVAEILALCFGKDQILYDKYHEAEFARHDLGIYLPKLYGEQADLIVPVLCPDYDAKRWTGWEWLHIYSLLTKADGHRVMPSRFDFAHADGLSAAAAFIELDAKSPVQFASLILERLSLNEGKPRTHYQLPSSASSSNIRPSPPSNLPGGYIGRIFLGRDDFLDDLRASLLKQTHATAITQRAKAATGISGLGGIGKTHAAVEYAHRYQNDYSALLFASGDSPEKLNASLALLCTVLHLGAEAELPPDESSRVAIAVDWLTTHRGWLLIIDNVDTEEAAAVIIDLLESLKTGHVLITSRLHSWADNVEPLDLTVLSPEAATDLLLQLTDKHRRKTDDDPAKGRQLADLMEGLPLALHQAAGYIREQRLTLADYLTIYEQEAAELLGWFKEHLIPYAGPEELGPRPVLITWKTSFEKLDAGTRFWLLVFSYFAPDPIPEFLLDSNSDAADEVKTRHRTARRALAQAENYSLLTRQDLPPRFKLHRLVQHIIRITSTEADCSAALARGIQLMAECSLGNPLDVRSWTRWSLLQAHATTLAAYAPNMPPPKHLDWLVAQLAALLKSKWLLSDAEPYFRRALLLEEACHGPRHPSVAIALSNLGSLLLASNQVVEAESIMHKALDIDEHTYGSDHPATAVRLNNLAQLLDTTGRLSEAEPLMRRVVRILEDHGGKPPHNYSVALNNLAQLLNDTNRQEEAEPLMWRALDIDTDCYGPDHPKVATRLNNLAVLLMRTNRSPEAEALMERAIKIDETNYGRDHPKVAIRLNNLAKLHEGASELAEAEPLMRKALGVFVRSLGFDHPTAQTVVDNYRTLLRAMNVPGNEIEKRLRTAVDEDRTRT